jgi:hypothetical protein
MIVDSSREIVQRPNTILAPYAGMRILLGVDDSQGRPFSNSGVRMIQIGFHTYNSRPFLVGSI